MSQDQYRICQAVRLRSGFRTPVTERDWIN